MNLVSERRVWNPDVSKQIGLIRTQLRRKKTPDMRINVSVPYIDPLSPSEDFTDSFKKSKTDHNKNPSQSQNICSWNVSRIRAFLKKNGFDYINQEDPDIVALQEVKCNYTELPNEAKP